MKTLLVSIMILTLAFASTSLAQEWTLGFSGEVGIPTGDFGDFASTGFGGMAMAGYNVSPDAMLTLKAGYLAFPGQDISFSSGGTTYTATTDYGIVPIVAGGKYFFSPGETRFYGSADIGIYLLSGTLEVTASGGSGSGSASVTTNESEFGITPGVGVTFKAGDNMNVDVHVNYANVLTSGSTTSWIGLGVGLNFDMK